jgi:hypothetical protein
MSFNLLLDFLTDALGLDEAKKGDQAMPGKA